MKTADVAVVGAGAAGLMAAIHAGRSSTNVVLLDSRPKIGAKILISGGTRCNVTNRAVTPSDYEGGPKHFLKHVFAAFPPEKTRAFFEGIGVTLVLEPSGKYFPVTHSGKTVLEALVKELGRSGAELRTAKVTAIRKKEGLFELETDKGGMNARRVVLATGGLSLPETGSDGTGLKIAEALGHTIVRTAPALTPLLSDDKDWHALSGLTLEDVRLDFYSGGKKRASSRGGFLFTHFGFSGPAALDISRHWALADAKEKPQIIADFQPAGEAKLPKRLFETLKKKCAGQTGKKASHYPLEVTGVYGYKKAEVTAGGVDLQEVNVSTMESKIVPGLFFAGEILDVDGRIGGFNFQWAWSTGAVAGRSAALRESPIPPPKRAQA